MKRKVLLLVAVASVATLGLAPSAGGSSGQDGPAGWIAVEGNGALRALNVQTGAGRQLALIVMSEAAWSFDGRELAYVEDGALRALTFRSGRERTIMDLGGRFSIGPNWSPRGDRLAFTVHTALSDTAKVVVVGRDGRHRRVVDHAALSYQVPQWSPDGRKIAYLRSWLGDAAIWVVRPDGGGRRILERGVLDYYHSLSWSPDGRRLAFVGRGGGGEAGVAVFVATADGAHVHAVTDFTTEFDEASIGSVQWSPTGGRIAFLRWNPEEASETSLCITDALHGERVVVKAPHIDDLAWSPDGRWLAYLTDDPYGVWVVRADGSSRKRIRRLYDEAESIAWR